MTSLTPEVIASEAILISDYVDDPNDAVEVATQLCSLICGTGTTVTEQGDFIMDAAHFQAFAALLRQNRLLVKKKLKKPSKRVTRRPLNQIPDDELENMCHSSKLGEADHFGLGATFKAKVMTGQYKDRTDDASASDATTAEKSAGDPFEIGDIVVAKPPEDDLEWAGEIVDADDAPPIVRTIRPDTDEPYHCVLIYPQGGFTWIKDADLSHTRAPQLRGLEQLAPFKLTKAGFRVAMEPSKWRLTFRTALQVMVEARKDFDIEFRPVSRKPESSANDAGNDGASVDDDPTPRGSPFVDVPDDSPVFAPRVLRSRLSMLGPEIYRPGDLVLAKVKGHPLWPGKVCDPLLIPMDVALDNPDRHDPAMYCIRFFPDADYEWIHSKDITRLHEARIHKFIKETRANFGPLLTGYKLALDSTEWDATHPLPPKLDERELEAAFEAQRKAQGLGLELDEEDEKPSKTPEAVTGQKRKRGHDSEGPHTKKRTTNGTKKGKNDPSFDPANPADCSGTSRKGGRNANSTDRDGSVAVKDEDASMDLGDMGHLETPVSPKTAAKQAEDKEALKVKTWRWLLQRGFLEHGPAQGNMDACDKVFELLEGYHDMTKYSLRFSKLPKVMDNILQLQAIPMDSEFRFKARARSLLARWDEIMNAEESPAPAPAPAAAQ